MLEVETHCLKHECFKWHLFADMEELQTQTSPPICAADGDRHALSFQRYFGYCASYDYF